VRIKIVKMEKVFHARVVAWHLVGIAAAAIDPTFRI
jgi:hypothetical protein